VAVDLLAHGANLEVGASHPLFGGQTLPDSFVVTRDTKRILGTVAVADSASPPLTLVTNWAAELARK
jgi:hypothetical protein